MRWQGSSEFALLPLTALASLLFSAPVFGQRPTLKPVQQVTVVDSNGKIVGHSFGGVGLHFLVGAHPSFEPTVLLQVAQRVVAVNVTKDRFYAGQVLFELENCQGARWFPPNDRTSESLLPYVVVGPPGNTIYLPQINALPQRMTFGSVLSFGNECSSFPFSAPGIPGDALINLDTVFTPPFSVRTIP